MITLPFAFSFEFFPPKNDDMAFKLWRTIERLAPYQPSFVSVTYGAGGSTRERTHDTVARLIHDTSLKPAAHLTCVSASRAEVIEVIEAYYNTGVRHIVALRGDPPEGLDAPYVPHPEGFQSTDELVSAVKRYEGMDVSVSAYPEVHPQSVDLEHDLDVLKAKVDAGASRAITQFFFDNDLFLRYRDKVAAARIAVEVVPGIAPIHSISLISRFAAKAGASVPDCVKMRFDTLPDDPDSHRDMAIEIGLEQIRGLVSSGVANIHFYTMNRSDLVTGILKRY